MCVIPKKLSCLHNSTSCRIFLWISRLAFLITPQPCPLSQLAIPLPLHCSPHLTGPPGAFPNGALFWWVLLMLCFFQYEVLIRKWKRCQRDCENRPNNLLPLTPQTGSAHRKRQETLYFLTPQECCSEAIPGLRKQPVVIFFLFKCLSASGGISFFQGVFLSVGRVHSDFLNVCWTLRHSYAKPEPAKS